MNHPTPQPHPDREDGGETKIQMEARLRADGWREAVLAAREGARLFPPDREKTMHRFGADTVVKAVEAGARLAGVRFAGGAS